MHLYDALAYPRLGILRCFARLAQHFVEIFLCGGAVGLPPAAYAVHVVGRSGAHRVVGIGPGVAKRGGGVLGHALYLEHEYFERAHDRRHTCRYHAEVFGTHEHVGGVDERRHLPHGFAIPEVVVAAIVEVVVETIETPLFVVVETTVLIGVLG